MKTTLKYLSIAVLSASLLSSCEEDGFNDETVDLGGYAYLEDTQISVLDRNADLDLTIHTAEGVTAESIEIFVDSSSSGNATISGENASFNSSLLGDFSFEDDAETGSYDIVVRTTYSNGNYSEDPFTIAVDKAVEIGSLPATAKLDSLDAARLNYTISTFSANIDNVDLMLKKNSNGTYSDSGLTNLAIDNDTISLNQTNYSQLNLAVNDTLYYKVTATSGDLMDEAESYFAITPSTED